MKCCILRASSCKSVKTAKDGEIDAPITTQYAKQCKKIDQLE